MANEIQVFTDLITQRINELIEVQTAFVIAKSVDWEQKIMTAVSQLDNLEYYDVLLGLGDQHKKPKVGSICLIGIIGNNAANTFLIEAEQIDETIIQSDETIMTIKKEGIIVKQGNESLKTVLNDMITEINKIIVINGRTINVAAMEAIKQRLNTILIE